MLQTVHPCPFCADDTLHDVVTDKEKCLLWCRRCRRVRHQPEQGGACAGDSGEAGTPDGTVQG